VTTPSTATGSAASYTPGTAPSPVPPPAPRRKKRDWLRRLAALFLGIVAVTVPAVVYAWYKFFREVDQPRSITANPATNFLYGSIGGENEGGLPYWIVVVLPRIFDDLVPGPGGYAAFGVPWEEGRELPAGFSKRTVGFDRVGFNCAMCHATQYRVSPDATPVVVAAGGSNTADIQGLLSFFSRAANDARFGKETIMPQIDMAFKLAWTDRLIYKYLLIPLTRQRLQEQGRDFAWAAHRPGWGPGRDAPMNLTKFNFLRLPMDSSVDNTDFPSLWNLRARVQPGRTWPAADDALTADWAKAPVPPSQLMLMNLDGATTSFRSVILDSGLGLQAQNSPLFIRRVKELEDWLMDLRAPSYPLPVDTALAARGRPLFVQACAGCHESGAVNRLGTVIPLAEIGTDAERVSSWTKVAADSANRTVRNRFGIRRTPMAKPAAGYVAVQLDGIWLRGPYLHNGSVPTLRALLEPEERRPATFYRGYDVLDRWNGGFVSRRCAGADAELPAASAPAEAQWGCMPNDQGWRYDTAERGNGNRGHRYGTELTDAQKAALVEYLKTR
jgi:mono/diheme cytochrome c family protein